MALEKLHGRDPAPLSFTYLEVLRQLEPYGLQDLVYTWMQVAVGYLALLRRGGPIPPPMSGRC